MQENQDSGVRLRARRWLHLHFPLVGQALQLSDFSFSSGTSWCKSTAVSVHIDIIFHNQNFGSSPSETRCHSTGSPEHLALAKGPMQMDNYGESAQHEDRDSNTIDSAEAKGKLQNYS
jgi:hypothetical protein